MSMMSDAEVRWERSINFPSTDDVVASAGIIFQSVTISFHYDPHRPIQCYVLVQRSHTTDYNILNKLASHLAIAGVYNVI